MTKQINEKIKLFLGFLVITMCVAFASQALAAAKMPHFVLSSASDGKEVDSDQFQGQVLLVTFFATWCPPCIEEIPALINMQDKYKEKGFSVIGISVDQGGAKTVAKLVEKTGINYPVLMADSKITRDFGGIVGIPTSFLINKSGNVVKSYPGYVPSSLLENDIVGILE
jgi:thiol-disulfide isomerase/thioredoxin